MRVRGVTDAVEGYVLEGEGVQKGLEGGTGGSACDGAVHLSAGEMFVVPKGVEHKPYAEREVRLLLVEPRDVRNSRTVASIVCVTRSARIW